MAHIRQILANLSISISEFKKSPKSVIKAVKNEPIAVISNNRPAFYCVPADILETLYQKFYEMNEIQNLQDFNSSAMNAVISTPAADTSSNFDVKDIFQGIDAASDKDEPEDLVDPINNHVADPLDEEVAKQSSHGMDHHLIDSIDHTDTLSDFQEDSAAGHDDVATEFSDDSHDFALAESLSTFPLKHHDSCDCSTDDHSAPALDEHDASDMATDAFNHQDVFADSGEKHSTALDFGELADQCPDFESPAESAATTDSDSGSATVTAAASATTDADAEEQISSGSAAAATHSSGGDLNKAAALAAAAVVATLNSDLSKGSANADFDHQEHSTSLKGNYDPHWKSTFHDGFTFPTKEGPIAGASGELDLMHDPIIGTADRDQCLEESAAMQEAMRDVNQEIHDNSVARKLVSGPHSFSLEHIAKTYRPYTQKKLQEQLKKDQEQEQPSPKEQAQIAKVLKALQPTDISASTKLTTADTLATDATFAAKEAKAPKTKTKAKSKTKRTGRHGKAHKKSSPVKAFASLL